MGEHANIAEQLFYQGYNCAQAVLCAFSDVTGLDAEMSARIASSFGGGIARMRGVCGAVSGGAMVLGLVRGYTDPTDNGAKKEHYHLVQEFARRFSAQNGSIICRDLLKGVGDITGADPSPRTPEYYHKRPCPVLIRQAAGILDEMLGE